MNSIIILLHLLLQINLCFASSNTHIFNTWCEHHGKRYSSEEEKLHRLNVFEDNLAFVMQHNNIRNSSYTLALNDFADLTHQEFKKFCLTLSFDVLDVQSVPKLSLSLRGSGVEGKLPSSVDWRKKGLITPVKSQAGCSTAWPVSAINAIESTNQIITGSLPKRKGVTMDGHTSLPSNGEEQLLQAVASQPVHVGICANQRVFQFYSKGIFSGPCSTSIDHVATIVGYDSENGVDYWTVKNSWGRQWGMNGYMHILRNSGDREGVCGINTLVSYPIKPKPNPVYLPALAQVDCNILIHCQDGETCCCIKSLIICLHYRCCPKNFPVCCAKPHHCCRSGYVCGVKKACVLDYKNSNMTELEQSLVWNFKR
ncbi:hypothetical protein AQUCO_01000603v1 [Aquilegia coerulea]|uniref:Galectin domain-containing protein n=1 Tax=Aquilegia coerulea TaxID=218851 RepID=A0A2G5EAW4_AQUCA|nr:hypothetical protein AQUCO_01000603v1 [Aquilegia coerulea]